MLRVREVADANGDLQIQLVRFVEEAAVVELGIVPVEADAVRTELPHDLQVCAPAGAPKVLRSLRHEVVLLRHARRLAGHGPIADALDNLLGGDGDGLRLLLGARLEPPRLGRQLAVAAELAELVAVHGGLLLQQLALRHPCDGQRVVLVLLRVGEVRPPILGALEGTAWRVLAELRGHGAERVGTELKVRCLDGGAEASGLRRHAGLQNDCFVDVATHVRLEAGGIGHSVGPLAQPASSLGPLDAGPARVAGRLVGDPAVDPVAPVVNDHGEHVGLVRIILEPLRPVDAAAPHHVLFPRLAACGTWMSLAELDELLRLAEVATQTIGLRREVGHRHATAHSRVVRGVGLVHVPRELRAFREPTEGSFHRIELPIPAIRSSRVALALQIQGELRQHVECPVVEAVGTQHPQHCWRR
mmetsp:Transcript_122890/g.319570  ORF Transcript_122890/g.319570 Transcript_122890/m.319570 type:complete len:416 (+) Transcript_122890:1655-2902(+)